MGKFLVGAVLVIAGLYLCVTAWLYTFQRSLIYHPNGTYYRPADAGLGDNVREVELDTPDGVKLVAWESKAEAGQPTLLYFHGNASTLKGNAWRLRLFADEGFGVFMPAYRGYSGSGGSPTEAALIADAQLAYDHLVEKGIGAKQIVVYGESLGTGVAVQLAASRPVAGIVLDAPYTALSDIGQARYPFVPVRALMTDQFDSVQYIARKNAPLLIMHGTLDRTIPLSFGKRLFDLAPEPKQMHILEGAAHSNIYDFGAMKHLRNFIDSQVLTTAAQ